MAYKAPIWEDGKSPAISAENLNNLSQAAEGAQVLYGNSAPTSSTEGAVGQFYLVVVADSDGNYPLYQCVAIANGSYVWRDTRRIPDSITSMLGIPAPGTINSALNVLAHVGNLHVWERVQTYAEEVPAGYTLGELQENVLVFTENNTDKLSELYYADSISVDTYGIVSLVSPSKYAFYANSNYSPGSHAKGKFFYIIPNTGSTAIDGIWFLPSDSNLNRNNNQYFAPTIQKVTGYSAIPAGTTTDYLTSTDRNAYTDGTVDNTTITYLGQLGGGARIEVGSYVGTGTYGSGNKNTLTFENKNPKKVTIVPKTHSNNSQTVSGSFPFVNGATSAVARLYLGSYSTRNVNLSWSDDSVSWYSTESADIQLNTKSSTYFYVAEF